ncbi:protein disulfide-isomerase A6 homolog [Convolutriloba macropyga]|uniref:protein disulfide-isomerase A6 homolog n=1 Tax=Convolutriloba macropyga TaxID=536237 RepID=UPI003F527033
MKTSVEIVLCAVLCCVTLTSALYSSSDSVIQLTPANFDAQVTNSKDLWLVEFYAPWCGHCKNLAPEWKKAAAALQGVVKIGAVDVDAHQEFGGRFGIKGFPTIKIFGTNKKSPTDYNGARTASGIVDSAMGELKKIVNARLGVKGGSSGGSGGSGNNKDVITLTESNFDEMVMQSEDMWLVEFFAPWCGHCKKLAPEWAKAATELKGKVKLGAVDATTETGLASKYGIRGYPTIKYFPSGKAAKQSPLEYDGGRTSSDIVSWAESKTVVNYPPPEVKQITSQEVLKEACEEHSICVLTFLPHILDDMASGRNKNLALIKKVGNEFKQKNWGWVWAEGGTQPAVENAVGVGGFGYPAMVVMNYKKKVFVTLRSAFDQDHVTELLKAVSVGRGRTEPLQMTELPKVDKIEAWDGKDGKPPVEEHDEF